MDPCPWFWIFIYRNGQVKILWLTDWLIWFNCQYLPSSDGVSTHMSRLEMSRDTYLHVSVLSQSRHIHVLSWLESCSSMSRLGSVSGLSCCVLAQCVLRLWHVRFEQLMLVKCNQHLMWQSMTVWQWYVLVRQSVYDCNVCFVKACRSNVKLFWLVSCLDTCVSQCLKSRTFSVRLSLIPSRPNPKCLGSSHVSIPVSWPMSVSRKKCLDSITVAKWLARRTPVMMPLTCRDYLHKDQLKRMCVFFVLFVCITVCLSLTLNNIFHMPMAQYSLFMSKMSLNVNTTNQPIWFHDNL